MSVANEKAKKIIHNFYDILRSPEMSILPGQLAFYFVMSIVPIAALAAALGSYLSHNFNFVETVVSVIPPILAKILKALTSDMHFNGIVFILVLYLFLGSNAPTSITVASNVFYEIEQPNYIKLKLKSFIMTIMIVVLLLFVVVIPLLGDIIVKFLTNVFNSNFLENYGMLYVIIKVFGSFVIMYFIIKILYTYAPSKKIDRKTTVKGSLFTSVGWILATYLFAFYITNVASYDVIYGNFANVLILLLWVYILAYLFVVGMALNVDDYHKQRECNNEKGKEKGKESENKRKTKNKDKE